MTLTRLTFALLLLGGAACNPGPAPTQPPKPHPEFPISDGAVHALGKMTSDGEIKCTTCHAITNTNFAQFQCIGCHEHAQTLLEPLHLSFDGYRYASSACYACHRDASTAHSPAAPLDSRDTAQDVTVTALFPSWSGTTILDVTEEDQTLPMPMNHLSTAIPDAAFSDCGNCHVDVALQRLFPGQFHASLIAMSLPPPKTCVDCHHVVPEGFVGDAGVSVPERVPPTGEMRHDAVEWANGAPTTTKIISSDCSVCHVAPTSSSSADWKTNARFHVALLVAGQAEPTSCLDCHANTRPTKAVTLASGIRFNHAAWLDDCATCHQSYSSWAAGTFHTAGRATPASCLPCHDGERPTTGPLTGPGIPFDFLGNDAGFTHGDDQDCKVCHHASELMFTSFAGGNFAHGAATPAAVTCAACHTTERPPAGEIHQGFDHGNSGTGDCFGCHQATTMHAAVTDWAGGQPYPGSTLISSSDQFLSGVTEHILKYDGGFVTGTTDITTRLYNAILHTSSEIPPALAPGMGTGDMTKCVLCHFNAPTSYAGGKLHSIITARGLTQPSACLECHANMRPQGIVGIDDLSAMDHATTFSSAVNIAGNPVTSVAQLDCSVCHASPGATWADGKFHSVPGVATAQSQTQCIGCHYLLMADAVAADVTRGTAPPNAMAHRSSQTTVQSCATCHVTAFGDGGVPQSTAWAPAQLHPHVSAPTTCIDCHQVTAPPQVTVSGHDGQGMNHTVAAVTGKDCAFCHAPDVGAAWSKSTLFHRAGVSPSSCSGCHSSNVPAAGFDTATVTSAPASTGRAGLHDEISHGDVNVTGHDCKFCHTAVGTDWSQASFHTHFTGTVALVLNGTTGRCSDCHLNLAPTSMFTAQDHTMFSNTGIDCSSCHAWPGTGTATAPNWQFGSGAGGGGGGGGSASSAPATISVGGFSVSMPPATSATSEAGINGLAHPAVPSGTSCTSCHTSSTGGTGAFGYDHALAPATGCAACHEAGSNLVGTGWTLNAAGAMSSSPQCNEGGGSVADRGGDTRPVGVAALACSAGAASVSCGGQNCSLNHFFPTDCGECHVKPAAVPSTTQTGSTYTGNWGFQHFFGPPAQQTTCCQCHNNASCRG